MAARKTTRTARFAQARACLETLEQRWLLAHFAVIGDFSSDEQTAPTRDVANLVKSWNPDFVATVGDNNYPDGASSTIDANVGQWYHQFISPYSGAYGAGATANEFFPAIGNHDYNSSAGYSPYLNYFNLPGNERYYTTVQKDVQIFVVNSESHEPDGTSSSSTQASWLKGALAASTSKWKIVLFHHPAYSSGSIGSNTFMQWPFQQWGATAVISGHDHDYERIIKSGFPYFVDGLGGESIVGFGKAVSGSAVRYQGDYGAMLIDSNSASITFKFINRSGQLIDSYMVGAVSSAPGAPTGLSASAQSSTEARLTWTDSSPSLTGSFKVERSSDGGANFNLLATTLTPSYLDQGLAPGGSYVYRVRASNSAGDSGYSNTASVTLPTGSTTFLSDMTWVSSTNGWGPVERDMSVGGSGANDGNPLTLNGVSYSKGLGAHASSRIVINLNKQYSSFLSDIGVDDEEIDSRSSSVVFQVLADGVKVFDSGTLGTTSATRQISLDVSNVTQLTLVVTDAGDGIDYDHADWAGARLQSSEAPQPPQAPTNLVATPVSPTQINLTWKDVLDESGYRMERSVDGVSFTPIASILAGVTSYADSEVSQGTLYYYRLIASNGAGDSGYSNIASATTPSGSFQSVYLSDLQWASSTNGWGPVEKDMSVGGSGSGDGHTLTLNGATYAKGLGAHALSDIVYNLNGAYSSFLSDIGVDDETGPGTVLFQVFADGAKIFDSGIMTQSSATKSINVSVNGVTQLRLHVDNGGDGADYDHADWAGARLLKPTGAIIAPAAPPGLSAAAPSSSQINLSWSNVSPTADGFHIYRLIGSTYALVGTTSGTAFQDSGLAAQTTYSYRVFAYNSAGESSGFASASATTQAAPAGLPSPWTQADVGSVTPPGTGTFASGTFTLTAAGTDVWNSADGIHFVYQPMSGDGTIIAKVTGITNTNGWAKAGIMMRQSLAANAPEAAMHVTPTNGTVFTYRKTIGGSSDGDFASGAAPYWVKLTRSGNVFTAYRSSDGATWTQVGTQTITMTQTIYVGLCVTSHNATAIATGTFTNVSVNGVTTLAPAVVQPPLTSFSSAIISPLSDLNDKDLLDALT
jgi:regulation of enolase protein 1 (concanavalin A-like superfamily)